MQMSKVLVVGGGAEGMYAAAAAAEEERLESLIYCLSPVGIFIGIHDLLGAPDKSEY